MRWDQADRAGKQAGMTLVEIMVVVAIISLVMAGVGVAAWKHHKKAQLKTAAMSVRRARGALTTFMMDAPGCPQNWSAVVDAGALESVPTDPWKRELAFRCPASESNGAADVWSMGPDGQSETEDDIRSWR